MASQHFVSKFDPKFKNVFFFSRSIISDDQNTNFKFEHLLKSTWKKNSNEIIPKDEICIHTPKKTNNQI